MSAVTRLGTVSLVASDPAALAEFYRRLLDLDVLFESPDFIALKGAGILLTMQRVEDHRPPDWPTGEHPKQMHLELAVDDLDRGEAEAHAIGARSNSSTSPSASGRRGRGWRGRRSPAKGCARRIPCSTAQVSAEPSVRLRLATVATPTPVACHRPIVGCNTAAFRAQSRTVAIGSARSARMSDS